MGVVLSHDMEKDVEELILISQDLHTSKHVKNCRLKFLEQLLKLIKSPESKQNTNKLLVGVPAALSGENFIGICSLMSLVSQKKGIFKEITENSVAYFEALAIMLYSMRMLNFGEAGGRANLFIVGIALHAKNMSNYLRVGPVSRETAAFRNRARCPSLPPGERKADGTTYQPGILEEHIIAKSLIEASLNVDLDPIIQPPPPKKTKKLNFIATGFQKGTKYFSKKVTVASTTFKNTLQNQKAIKKAKELKKQVKDVTVDWPQNIGPEDAKQSLITLYQACKETLENEAGLPRKETTEAPAMDADYLVHLETAFSNIAYEASRTVLEHYRKSKARRTLKIEHNPDVLENYKFWSYKVAAEALPLALVDISCPGSTGAFHEELYVFERGELSELENVVDEQFQEKLEQRFTQTASVKLSDDNLMGPFQVNTERFLADMFEPRHESEFGKYLMNIVYAISDEGNGEEYAEVVDVGEVPVANKIKTAPAISKVEQEKRHFEQALQYMRNGGKLGKTAQKLWRLSAGHEYYRWVALEMYMEFFDANTDVSKVEVSEGVREAFYKDPNDAGSEISESRQIDPAAVEALSI